MYEVGSAVVHPVKNRIWRVARIDGQKAWLRPMTGRDGEEGPFDLSRLISGVSAPIKFTF